MTIKFFNLRIAPPVQLQEVMVIHKWRVAQVRSGTQVLVGVVGQCADRITVRMTSSIVVIDPGRRTMQTASGRVYLLSGPPAHDELILEMITRRLAISGHWDAIDVTDALWETMEAVTRH